ncbi:hypothetical protein J6590_065312 [Homalodisca vitripennis]|nr:hypothetical protein J6590_065312 [Homalodisca vitripennis]
MSSSVPCLLANCAFAFVFFPCATFCGLTPHTCARHRVLGVSVLFIPIRFPLSIAPCALCLIGLRHSCDSAAAGPATAAEMCKPELQHEIPSAHPPHTSLSQKAKSTKTIMPYSYSLPIPAND